MPKEIERKFLVDDDVWQQNVRRSESLDQGYFACVDVTVRVRIADGEAFLTIKGRTIGVTRSEFEYPVPVDEASAMLDQFCEGRRVSKTRHYVQVADHVWVIDVFAGDNEGLVLAEVELDSEDEDFELPSWAGEEVSGDARYYNSNLAREPFQVW